MSPGQRRRPLVKGELLMIYRLHSARGLETAVVVDTFSPPGKDYLSR